MATITKQFLSGSTNGRPIKIAANATPGTTLHTADAAAKDEVYLYLHNTSGSDVNVTVEFGGVTNPDDRMTYVVPANDSILAVSGVPLSNSLVVKAFAGTANVINASGYVNRIA